jgi:hypothetical protein
MPGEVLFSCSVRIRDTGSQIGSNAVAFAGKWSKFRCTGESTADVLSRVMAAPAQHICQSHLALRHSWWYWVLRLEYETRLAYSRQTGSFWWHLIEVYLHRKSLCPYPYNQLITAHLPFTVAIKSVYAIWVLLSEYKTLAHLFLAKLQLLVAYHWSSGRLKIRIAKCQILRHGSRINS